MKNQLVIKEKYSKYWPTATVLSIVLSILFFISYQLVDDVLWIGYLRLLAFAFFAVALLSFFKVYDGQVEIMVTSVDDFIEASYSVRDEEIFNSRYPRSDFHQVKTDQLPDKSIYNDFMKSDKCVRFKRKDESAWNYFNEIESRVIPLSEGNANKLRDFLERHSEA
jgi:hypothetical protein